MVHLGHGGDGRARAAPRDALFDRDRGREPLDRVRVRPGGGGDVLPHVGGETFEVEALPLREDDIEGEGGFAGAARAGEDDEPVPRDGDPYVFEVVLTGARDRDCRGGGLRGRMERGRLFAAGRGLAAEARREEGRGPGFGACRHLLRGPACHDLPASLASLGAEVDHVVRALDELHVVLDDEETVAPEDEVLERFDEEPYVVVVQPRRRLVENEEHVAFRALRHVAGELQSLCLPAREGAERLPEREVAESDRRERIEAGGDPRGVREEPTRLADGHREHLDDRLPAEADAARLRPETAPAALGAAHEGVGEKLHLHLLEPLARALGAAPAGDIE